MNVMDYEYCLYMLWLWKRISQIDFWLFNSKSVALKVEKLQETSQVDLVCFKDKRKNHIPRSVVV